MKVLVVNDQYESGGAARVAATMCNGLLINGFEIHTASNIQKNSIRYTLDSRVVLHSVDFSTHGKGNLARLFSLFRTANCIRRVIKESRPDVIIAIQANGFIRTLIGSIGYRIPIIAADHTSFARKMDFINTLTRHHLYKYADALSILTQRDAKILGAKYPQKQVIYNPIPYKISLGSSLREKTVLCAGRFDIWKIKGFDLMIEMWAELSPKHPDWKLVFAGTGKSESVNYIMSLIHKHNLEDSVVLLGQVNNMVALYSKSGIFALPSRIEGFPMVLLEAMSQGCPCVAFNVGGASEEMIEKGAGYVIEDHDTASFTSSLDDLMSNDDIRNTFSQNATHSVEKFSEESFINEWVNLINKTVLSK